MVSRKVLVSGASRGLGFHIAKEFLARNADVWGIARNFSQTPKVPGLNQIEHDLSLSMPDSLPVVDTLVCNVGRALLGHLEEYSAKEIEKTISLNFLSHVLLVKQVLPAMKKEKKGSILFIGSESALEGKRKGTVYCATKFAIRGFAQALKDEVKKSGIHISILHPGVIKETSFFDGGRWEATEEALCVQEVAKIAVEMLELKIHEKTIGAWQAHPRKRSQGSIRA